MQGAPCNAAPLDLAAGKRSVLVLYHFSPSTSIKDASVSVIFSVVPSISSFQHMYQVIAREIFDSIMQEPSGLKLFSSKAKSCFTQNNSSYLNKNEAEFPGVYGFYFLII